MKVIIAGSRTITKYKYVVDAINKAKNNDIIVSEVVSGEARGVDTLGEQYAKENNLPISKHPALWDLHGKSAGYIRNVQMAEYADALICVWDGKSKGSKHMIDIATSKGLKIFVYTPTEKDFFFDL